MSRKVTRPRLGGGGIHTCVNGDQAASGRRRNEYTHPGREPPKPSDYPSTCDSHTSPHLAAGPRARSSSTCASTNWMHLQEGEAQVSYLLRHTRPHFHFPAIPPHTWQARCSRRRQGGPPSASQSSSTHIHTSCLTAPSPPPGRHDVVGEGRAAPPLRREAVPHQHQLSLGSH